MIMMVNDEMNAVVILVMVLLLNIMVMMNVVVVVVILVVIIHHLLCANLSTYMYSKIINDDGDYNVQYTSCTLYLYITFLDPRS